MSLLSFYLGISSQSAFRRAIWAAIAMVICYTAVIVLFIIPIPTVVRLKMPLAQKLGAVLIFAVGSL
jgi:hypothetical protein